MIFVSAIAFGLVLLLAFAINGVNTTSLINAAVVWFLMLIPIFFSTRGITNRPSIAERVAAHTWVWLRRFLGLGLGGAMIFGGVYMATLGKPDVPGFSWVGVILMVAFGAFLCYFGIVGSGPERNAWRDDINQYKEKKKRYGFWF
jgi:hypothetical protein